METKTFGPQLKGVMRQRSLQIALLLWILLSVAAVVLCRGGVPLNRPDVNHIPVTEQVILSDISLFVLLLWMGLVWLLTRRRALPDLAERAPERRVALWETAGLWIYAATVLAAGQWLGLRLFGEGIALHLNGTIVGATRVQSPREVCLWAAYNGFFLALLPYIAFRLRGYSRESLNLRSLNWKNDLLVIIVVLAIGGAFELMGPNIFQLRPRQELLGGLLSLIINLAGTALPIMIFIYAILMPRYFRLAPPALAYLLAAASYPTMHVFESWTRYDTFAHGVISIVFVFLTFFPPGLMKSFLTLRTGNAWVHMWAFHAFTPHVVVDTRLIVDDFKVR